MTDKPAFEKAGKPGLSVAARLRQLADAMDAGAPVNAIVVTDDGWIGMAIGPQQNIIVNLMDAMLTRREEARAAADEARRKAAQSSIIKPAGIQ